jgi:hypothetical protein
MRTASAIETLQAFGVEAVSKQTHISQDNIKRLLEHDFDAFTPIQFNGFITILEREYDLELSQWREDFALTHAEIKEPVFETEHDPFADMARSKKRQRLTVAVLAGLLFLVVILFFFIFGGGEKDEKVELNNTAIEQAKANLAVLNARTAAEKNVSEATAVSAPALQESEKNVSISPKTPPVSAPESIVIYPASTIWLGIIDEQTHKRQVKVTDQAVRLDGSKNWLIVTGHGYLTLQSGDENATFKQTGKMYFACKAGNCSQLDEEGFKALNRGVVW